MKKIFVFLAAMLLLVVMACSPSGWGTSEQPITFTPKSDVIVTSNIIDKTGGTIAAGNTGTPIDGVVVSFPAGALPAGNTVSLGYNTGTVTPNGDTYAGIALLLNTGNVIQFDQPVSITVPFTDISKVPVPYYVDSSGKLHLMRLIAVDRTAKTFTFQTFHASWYTWFLADTTGPDITGDTHFVPGHDGFQIGNIGNEYNTYGECGGMTSFSSWYFMYKKTLKGNFFPKYYNIVGTDNLGNVLRGQDVIATRAFTSITNAGWDYYKKLYESEAKLPQEDRYINIINAILRTGNPVLILLYHSDGRSGLHSVLAYAFNMSDGTISIYDPTYPGDNTRTITYDKTSKRFNTYESFDGIVFDGDGSFRLGESYQNILDDADANFAGSGNAIINLTSPANGEQVTERNITLSGNIQSGEVLVTKLTVWVNSAFNPFSVNVGADGAFSLPVTLNSGINHLMFTTQGITYVTDAQGKTASELISVANNMNTSYFTVNAIAYNISGRVTLNGVGLTGVTITITGASSVSTATDPSGNYSFSNATNGSYTLTPSMTGYTFSPTTSSITVSNANLTGQNFTATATATNTWTPKADFGGAVRSAAVGFSIGSKGYIGTGGVDLSIPPVLYKDFWEYDPTTDTWTQKADFGGAARYWAFGFSIGSKGYIGTGYDLMSSNYHDLWEYDSDTNTWTKKSDFAGGLNRIAAVSFSIGSKGYAGTGSMSGFSNDFWEYNPATNAWTQKADFGGTARNAAVGFSIGTKGYIGTGWDMSYSYMNDFWEYDPDANTWTRKADFGGAARSKAVGFSIGKKGYIGTGASKDLWEYDPDADTWTQKADFGGAVRSAAVGFSIGSKGYIGTGTSNGGQWYKDFWEYNP